MQCLKCGNDFDSSYECPVCSKILRESGRFNRIVTGIEDFLIVFFLGLMVVTVLLQIMMRNLFQSGISGGDDLVRHLVLWIAFLGAGIATRSRSHVKIDVLSNLAGGRIKKYADIIVNLFSCAICAILMVAAGQFVFIEYESQVHTQFLNLPIWTLETVMPLGYLIISVRFAHNCISGAKDMFREKSN